MAYGGGTWLFQNKVLPGTYINFSSVSKASATLSDRGVAALPIPLAWGPEGAAFEVTNGDFQKNSMSIFGYPYDADAMLPMRDLFRNAKTCYFYRLAGTTTKAICQISAATVATAKYGGSRGNALRLVIAANVDDPALFDVKIFMDDAQVDEQIGVAAATDLKESRYVTWAAGFTLEVTAGANFTGGGDGTVNGLAHQNALDALESYAFNTLGCCAADNVTKSLYVQYTMRMRDEVGAKFQLVGYRIPAADYEGVISVENAVTDYPADVLGLGEQGLVYWVLGAEAGCEVNRSCTNKQYNGDLTVNADYTQKQLEDAVKAGKLIFHNANGAVRVLDDINTLLTLSDTKGQIFQSNQTIRVCDQIANDTAVLFNTRYVGTVPNDASGRMSLWNDICKLIQELERIRAVENFDTKTLVVEQGDQKKAVLCTITGLNVVNAMAQLYMHVIIQ
jgi:hypothetical protein